MLRPPPPTTAPRSCPTDPHQRARARSARAHGATRRGRRTVARTGATEGPRCLAVEDIGSRRFRQHGFRSLEEARAAGDFYAQGWRARQLARTRAEHAVSPHYAIPPSRLTARGSKRRGRRRSTLEARFAPGLTFFLFYLVLTRANVVRAAGASSIARGSGRVCGRARSLPSARRCTRLSFFGFQAR